MLSEYLYTWRWLNKLIVWNRYSMNNSDFIWFYFEVLIIPTYFRDLENRELNLKSPQRNKMKRNKNHLCNILNKYCMFTYIVCLTLGTIRIFHLIHKTFMRIICIARAVARATPAPQPRHTRTKPAPHPRLTRATTEPHPRHTLATRTRVKVNYKYLFIFVA